MAKRIAALYDIHGNLSALVAQRSTMSSLAVTCSRPMVRETLACLHDLDVPVQFIHGNGEVAALAQIVGKEPAWYRSSPADAKAILLPNGLSAFTAIRRPRSRWSRHWVELNLQQL